MKGTFKLILIVFTITLLSCEDKPKSLPFIGHYDVVDGDTIYPQIPDFSFIDQDSNIITNKTFENGIYVADFFFTHCPTICPKVSANMLRLQEAFSQYPNFRLLAHTVDVKNDTIPRLKEYAEKIQANTKVFHFVTGREDDIYEIADDYYSIARKDPTVPGGFDHSGRIILIDQNRHVRSFCDGTDNEDVNRFIEDIRFLLDQSK